MQSCWGQKDVVMFLKEVSYSHQGFIYLIKKKSKIVKYFYNLK